MPYQQHGLRGAFWPLRLLRTHAADKAAWLRNEGFVERCVHVTGRSLPLRFGSSLRVVITRSSL
jgi:hypothetical protein